jgi:hypothetical protein
MTVCGGCQAGIQAEHLIAEFANDSGRSALLDKSVSLAVPMQSRRRKERLKITPEKSWWFKLALAILQI